MDKPPSRNENMLKVNSRNTSRVCSELTVDTLKRDQRPLLTALFIVYFEQISNLVLMLIL